MTAQIKLYLPTVYLEVSTGEFTEHNKEDYITWGLDFNYDPTIRSRSDNQMDTPYTI